MVKIDQGHTAELAERRCGYKRVKNVKTINYNVRTKIRLRSVALNTKHVDGNTGRTTTLISTKIFLLN